MSNTPLVHVKVAVPVDPSTVSDPHSTVHELPAVKGMWQGIDPSCSVNVARDRSGLFSTCGKGSVRAVKGMWQGIDPGCSVNVARDRSELFSKCGKGSIRAVQ
jgi:hypothetical protein